MRPTFTSKLPDVGTTIFTVMSQLAVDFDAINLAQGFPGFEPPRALTDRISFHLTHGANQYAPMPGVPALRAAIAAKTLRLQGRVLDPGTEITVSSGATEGLFSAIQAFVKPGDEVVFFDPAFDSYDPAVRLAGGVSRRIPLAITHDGRDFEPDWDRLEGSLNERTRLVIVNFPHNPTGAVLSRTDLDRLAGMLRDTRVLVLSDEVYEHIVFDGRRHISVLSHDELWERSLVVSSFGKTFHATGWKIGYCMAPAGLTGEFRKVHQYTTFSVSTPMQRAIADFLESDPGFYAQLPVFYQRLRDHFCALLAQAGFRFTPAKSTFFQVVDYGSISGEADVALAERWTRELRVASIPMSVFCAKPFTGTRLRFCFAKDEATLTRAVERLRRR
jgi:methionine aminotransferase